MLRTIELILGLPPMSQYDAGAPPLYAAFTGNPNMGVYRAAGARVPLDEKKCRERRSGPRHRLPWISHRRIVRRKMLLNEIIWRSVKGAHSRMPPARRSLFVRANGGDDDDDDQ